MTVAISGLVALAVAMGIGRFAFTPILPMMQGDYGLSVAGGGWLASANYAGYLAGALSAVWLRAGSAVVIRGSLALIAVVTIGMGLIDRFELWMILRAAAGVASAWAMVFVSAWCLDRLAPHGRPMLGSAVFSGVGTGIALAGGLCLALMRSGAGAPQAWLVLGVVSLVLTAIVWPVFGSRPTLPSRDDEHASAGRFRWTGDAVLIVACYGVFGFGYIIPATFVPAMARQIVSDPAVFGWSWPLFGLAAMVSTLAASGFISVLGNRCVWIACSLVMAVGVAAPVSSPGMTAIMLAAVCVGATFMVITMAGIQEARRVGAARSRSLMAAMTASFAAGQIAGPLAVSWLAAAGGSMNTVLIAAAGLLVASAAALAWSSTKERKTIEALSE